MDETKYGVRLPLPDFRAVPVTHKSNCPFCSAPPPDASAVDKTARALGGFPPDTADELEEERWQEIEARKARDEAIHRSLIDSPAADTARSARG